MDSASSSSLSSMEVRMAEMASRSACESLRSAMVFSSASNSLMAYQRAALGATLSPSTLSILTSASSTAASNFICDAGAFSVRAASMAALTTSSMPRPFSAEVGTMGQPSSRDRPSTSILSPFFSTRSIMFSAMTTGIPRFRIWLVRYRLRSRLVASTRLITASGPPSSR